MRSTLAPRPDAQVRAMTVFDQGALFLLPHWQRRDSG